MRGKIAKLRRVEHLPVCFLYRFRSVDNSIATFFQVYGDLFQIVKKHKVRLVLCHFLLLCVRVFEYLLSTVSRITCSDRIQPFSWWLNTEIKSHTIESIFEYSSFKMITYRVYGSWSALCTSSACSMSLLSRPSIPGNDQKQQRKM